MAENEMVGPVESRYRSALAARDQFGSSVMGQAFLAEQARKREARGRPLGLSGDEIAACDELGMAPDRYALMKSVSTLEQFKAAEDEFELRRRVAAQARVEKAVEAATRGAA